MEAPSQVCNMGTEAWFVTLGSKLRQMAHQREDEGWRRLLPGLIYNIQIDLVGHQESDLSARPIHDRLLIGKLVFELAGDSWTLTVTIWDWRRVSLSPPIRLHLAVAEVKAA